MRLQLLRSMTGILLAIATASHAEVLVQHSFGGSASSPLQGISPDGAVSGVNPWIASSIIAANGEVNDGTNTDRGAYIDLGSSFAFKPDATYTLKLGYSALENAILFAGFSSSAPSAEAQMQTQGTNFALRIREQTTTPGKGLWRNPGSLFTAGTTTNPAGAGEAALVVNTNALTNARVSVEGSAAQIVDLSVGYRYLWIGFEDPAAASPASSARFTLLQLDGPLPDPPVVPPTQVVFDPPSGIVPQGATVSLSSSTTAVQIRYTRDGTEPTAASEAYSTPLAITTSGEIRAKAFKEGLESESSSAFHAVVPGTKPNVVLILGESIGSGDLSSFGSVGIHTPVLDQLADEGTRFTGATLPASGAIHGVQAVLTGRSARRTGLNAVPGADTAGISPNEWTLAEALRKTGYATGFVGEWELGSAGGMLPYQQGYQFFHGLPWSVAAGTAPPLQKNNEILEATSDPATLLANLTGAAKEFIGDHASTKFFLTLKFPAVAASGGSSVQGSNGNRIEALDSAVGEILDALEEHSLGDHTLVLFASVSSAARATPGPSLGTNAVLRDGDGSTWEGGLRVPVIARWPGVIPPQVQSIATLPLTDVFHSITAISSGWLPDDRPYDGTARPEILLGIRNGLTPDVTLAASHHEGGSAATRTVRDGKWKLHLAYRNTDSDNSFSQAVPLLFDLAADPSERTNRASAQPALVASLTAIAAGHEAGHSSSVVQLPASRPPFLAPVRSEISEGAFVFHFERPAETIDDRYAIEVSEDLVVWTALPLSAHVVSRESTPSSSERLEVRYQPSAGPVSGRLFARVRGTNP